VAAGAELGKQSLQRSGATAWRAARLAAFGLAAFDWFAALNRLAAFDWLAALNWLAALDRLAAFGLAAFGLAAAGLVAASAELGEKSLQRSGATAGRATGLTTFGLATCGLTSLLTCRLATSGLATCGLTAPAEQSGLGAGRGDQDAKDSQDHHGEKDTTVHGRHSFRRTKRWTHFVCKTGNIKLFS
jgi:hypothetical protein